MRQFEMPLLRNFTKKLFYSGSPPDNKIKKTLFGTVIGNKSAYRPCSYGDLLAYELPNTIYWEWILEHN
jgi:hypothetical protein